MPVPERPPVIARVGAPARGRETEQQGNADKHDERGHRNGRPSSSWLTRMIALSLVFMINDSAFVAGPPSSVDRAAEVLRRRAASLPVGAKLPSTRTLVRDLDVGPVTVQKALGALVAEGLVITRPGAGTFVARPTTRSTAGPDTAWQQVSLGVDPVDASAMQRICRVGDPGVLQLASAFTDTTLQPQARLAAAMSRASRRPDIWSSAPPLGLPELRAWFATQAGAAADDVLITSGGQSALSATLRSLARPGERVLFAVPTYPGALAIARAAGIVAVPVPADHDGVRPDQLARAFASTGARALYLQPTWANPDGSVLAAQRRAPVLAAAAAAGAFVIEDDYARLLGHGGPTPPSLLASDTEGRVINLTSLTKVVAQGLRVGAVIARGPVLRRIAALRLVDDLYVTPVLQAAAVELVTGPGWRPHLKQLSAALADRAAVMGRELAARLPQARFTPPRGSMSIWLALPTGMDETSVTDAAAANGVAVGPGSPYWIGNPESAHLRLCFGGIPVDHIGEAISRLAAAVAA